MLRWLIFGWWNWCSFNGCCQKSSDAELIADSEQNEENHRGGKDCVQRAKPADPDRDEWQARNTIGGEEAQCFLGLVG